MSKETIYRQEAIEAIKRYESVYSYDLNNGLILAMNAVADVPTIEEQPETPCDLCCHNPPSSGDGKPCSYCPAEGE